MNKMVSLENEEKHATKKKRSRRMSKKMVNIISESQNKSGIMKQERSNDGSTSEENED
jgi:hypothetical protein